MRLSIALLGLSLLGVLAGGWLTGRLGFGLCVIADSIVLGAAAVLRDDGRSRGDSDPDWAVVQEGAPSLYDVMERSRRSG